MNFIDRKNINLAIIGILTTFSTHAAVPAGGPPPPTPPPPPGLPIDGNILVLFFIAISYGIYCLRKSQINLK